MPGQGADNLRTRASHTQSSTRVSTSRLPVGDENGVFIVGGQAPIGGHGGPAVPEHLHPPVTRAHHGLHGDGHTGLEPGAMARWAKVGYLRRLVEFGPHTVAHEVPHDGAAVCFHVLLHRVEIS